MPSLSTVEKIMPISVKQMDFNTGTWTFSSNSGIPYQGKSANAETTVITIPITLPRLSTQYGVKLKSIKLPLRIGTADLSGAATIALYRTNRYLATNGAAANITASAVATTDNSLVTNSATDRLWTVTVTSPSFDLVDGGSVTDADYVLIVTLPCAAGTVLRVYNAAAVFDSLE